MALIRVAQYNSTPTVVGDYQAQNAHLQAFTNQLMTQQFILDSGTAQPVIKQGCYVSHGGSLYVADADTAITGSPSDGSVYIRVSGTTSLTVEFVTDISGYAWNPVYSALTSGSYTLLPYLIVKASTVWTRYNFNPNNQQFGSLASLAVTGNTTVGGTLGVTGAISGASLGVTGAISGATVDTGQGATEVHLMNQNLRTTDSVTFKNLNATGDEGIRSAGSRQWGAFGGGSTNSTTYTKLGNTLRFKKGGIFTFYFGVKSGSNNYYAYGKIYKNDVAFGTERSNISTSFEYYSENLSVSAGDVLSIRAKQENNDLTAEVSAVRVSQAEEGNEV